METGARTSLSAYERDVAAADRCQPLLLVSNLDSQVIGSMAITHLKETGCLAMPIDRASPAMQDTLGLTKHAVSTTPKMPSWASTLDATILEEFALSTE